MDVYLAGTGVEIILTEITCGDMRIKGVKLVIPKERWETVNKRLDELDQDNSDQHLALLEFLTNRCHKDFLRLYISNHPTFIESLRFGSWMRYHSGVLMAARLHGCRMLPKIERERFAVSARYLAVNNLDADFLDVPRIKAMLKPSEIKSILDEVFLKAAPKLRSRVAEMRRRCIREDADPDDFFWVYQRAIRIYRNNASEDFAAQQRFRRAYWQLDRHVKTLTKRREKMERDLVSESESEGVETPKVRSIFDDVAD
jgi:hypothetical protein